MRHTLIIITLFISLSSCDHYSTIYTDVNSESKLAIQQYYSSCAGLCGQRIILDNLKGVQYSLILMCDIENMNCKICTINEIGTQKNIAFYSGKYIRQIDLYRPVYDTIELKKIYPNLKRDVYYDTLLLTNPVLPLTNLDSALINKALEYKSDTTCKTDYIKLIRGYIFIGSRLERYPKETNFKNSK